MTLRAIFADYDSARLHAGHAMNFIREKASMILLISFLDELKAPRAGPRGARERADALTRRRMPRAYFGHDTSHAMSRFLRWSRLRAYEEHVIPPTKGLRARSIEPERRFRHDDTSFRAA